jgi:hypothetical protein
MMLSQRRNSRGGYHSKSPSLWNRPRPPTSGVLAAPPRRGRKPAPSKHLPLLRLLRSHLLRCPFRHSTRPPPRPRSSAMCLRVAWVGGGTSKVASSIHRSQYPSLPCRQYRLRDLERHHRLAAFADSLGTQISIPHLLYANAAPSPSLKTANRLRRSGTPRCWRGAPLRAKTRRRCRTVRHRQELRPRLRFPYPRAQPSRNALPH